MEDKSKGSLEKIILAGIGTLVMPLAKTKEVLEECVKQGELTVERGKAINEELKHRVATTVAETNKSVEDFAVSQIIQTLGKLSHDGRAQILSKIQELDKS